MTTQNQKTEPARVADTQSAQAVETALADSETAFDAELGFLPGDDAEQPPEINEDPDLQADPDPSDDPAETTDADDEPAEGDEGEDDPNEEEEPPEDEDADDEPDFSSIPKEHQAAVGKLISKARTKERSKTEAKINELSALAEKVPTLESERTTLQSQLDDLKAAKSVPAPTSESPYANVVSIDDLKAKENLLWDHRRELMSNPDEVQITDPLTGQLRYLKDGEANARIAQIDERLQRYLPVQRKFLEEHATLDKQLVADFPDLEREGSTLKQSVNRILAARPELKLTANYRRTALAQAIGEQVLTAQGKEAWAYSQGKPVKSRSMGILRANPQRHAKRHRRRPLLALHHAATRLPPCQGNSAKTPSIENSLVRDFDDTPAVNPIKEKIQIHTHTHT